MSSSISESRAWPGMMLIWVFGGFFLVKIHDISTLGQSRSEPGMMLIHAT